LDNLTAILIAWISANFGLPVPTDDPDIIFASKAQMMEVRLASVASADTRYHALESQLAPDNDGYGLYALYNDETGTLYLREDFSAALTADVSILLHEMVHHIQNEADMEYECAEKRERLAYRVQNRWLESFGTNLEREFGLDPMTVLVRTNCWY
jgi:hypothetical protein